MSEPIENKDLENKVARIKGKANELFRKWVAELEADATVELDNKAVESEILQAYMTAGFTIYMQIKKTLEEMGGVIEARSTKNVKDPVLYKVYRTDTGEVLDWCSSLAEAEETARLKSLEFKSTPINYEAVVQEQ